MLGKKHKKPLQVALIGAGIMGSDHARIMVEDIPNASLKVVCDASEDAAAQLAASHGINEVETDPLATIARADIDAVIIASPDHTHAELTLAALAVEKPVLCEKPLAPDSKSCVEVMNAEMALGRRLIQVGFMRRFDPAYVQMKSVLNNGAIGQPLMMHNFHRNVEAPSVEFTGLMAITNSAPHEFDAVRYVLSQEVTAISAFEPEKVTDGVCKPVVMVLQTSDGLLVTIEVNNIAAYGYDVRGELIGTAGSISLNDTAPVRIDRKLQSSVAYAEDWRPRFAEAYRQQNRAWIDSIFSGNPASDASTAWDGYCASAIAEAGAKALATGARESINLIDKPRLYQSVSAS